ncbi:hypothetical protein HDU67_010304 [Dinochytrium kinnereticum]|nr:hypothetical protein HDU67_010304 [Dinochytrium kinnereticum]
MGGDDAMRLERNQLRRLEILVAEIASLEGEIEYRQAGEELNADEIDLDNPSQDESHLMVVGSMTVDLAHAQSEYSADNLILRKQLSDQNRIYQSIRAEHYEARKQFEITSTTKRILSGGRESVASAFKEMQEKKAQMESDIRRVEAGMHSFLTKHVDIVCCLTLRQESSNHYKKKLKHPHPSATNANTFSASHLINALISRSGTPDPYLTVTPETMPMAEILINAQVVDVDPGDSTRIRIIPFHEQRRLAHE